MFYRDGNWLARVNLRHAFAQNDVSAVETPTSGYNLLKAEISYTRKINEAGVPIYEVTIGMTATTCSTTTSATPSPTPRTKC